jgi:methyl-accepting chemotaxis protein
LGFGIEDLCKAVKEFGYALVFFALYTATVWFLIRLLSSQLRERKEEVEKMTAALDRSSEQNKSLADAMKEMRTSLDASMKQSSELLIWVKAREEQRR